MILLLKSLFLILIFIFNQVPYAYADVFTGQGAAPAGFAASMQDKSYDYSNAVFYYYQDYNYGSFHDFIYQLAYGKPKTPGNVCYMAKCNYKYVYYINQPSSQEVNGNEFAVIDYPTSYPYTSVKFVYLNANIIQPNYVYDSVNLWHNPVVDYAALAAACIYLVGSCYVLGLSFGLAIKAYKYADEKYLS